MLENQFNKATTAKVCIEITINNFIS